MFIAAIGFPACLGVRDALARGEAPGDLLAQLVVREGPAAGAVDALGRDPRLFPVARRVEHRLSGLRAKEHEKDTGTKYCTEDTEQETKHNSK